MRISDWSSDVCSSDLLPSLLPAIDAALAREQSVVVQLVSTSEALLSRRLADLSAEDRAELDTLDLSPRELVMDYLQAAFPPRAMEVLSDDDGTDRSRLTSNPKGTPAKGEEALIFRDIRLELLGRTQSGKMCSRKEVCGYVNNRVFAGS